MHAPADGVLAFHNGDVLVIANMGLAAATLPEGYRVALASADEAVTGGPAESGTAETGPAETGTAGSGTRPDGARKLAPDSAVYLVAV
ncbi:hypothetical protein D9M72_595710 [compost metagenome]